MWHSPLSDILHLPLKTEEAFELPVEQVPFSRKPVFCPQQFEPYAKKNAYIFCSTSPEMRNLLLHYAISSFTKELNEAETISWYMTMINAVIPMPSYPILGSEVGYNFIRLFVLSLDDLMKMMANLMDVFQQHFHHLPSGQSHLVSMIVVGVLCMFIGKNVTRENYLRWSFKFMERFMHCFRVAMDASDCTYLPSIVTAMHLNGLFRPSCTMRRYVLVAIDAASMLPGTNTFSVALNWLKMARLTEFHLILKYLCGDEVHPVLRLPGWDIERIALQSSISKWLSVPKAHRPYARIIYADDETGIFSSQALRRPAYAALLIGRMINSKLNLCTMRPPHDAEVIEQAVISAEKDRCLKEKSKGIVPAILSATKPVLPFKERDSTGIRGWNP